MQRALLAGLMILLCGTFSSARGQDGLPPGSRPLSRTLQLLEQKKFQPSSISLDQRQWRVEGIQGKDSFRLQVDPRNGRIISQEKIPDLDPVEGSMPVSRIIRKMEEANAGPIVRVHYQKKNWVIETRRGKNTTEIQLSADTGELTMGRDKK